MPGWLRFDFLSKGRQFPRRTQSLLPLSGRAWTSLPGRCFHFRTGRTRLKIGEHPKPESELLCPPVAMRREGAPGDCGRGCLSPQNFRCLCSFRHGPLLQGGVAAEGVQQIGIDNRMVRCRKSVRCCHIGRHSPVIIENPATLNEVTIRVSGELCGDLFSHGPNSRCISLCIALCIAVRRSQAPP